MMMGSIRLASALALALALGLGLALAPTAARADGMIFRDVSATASVQATEQRAVLWLRDGSWEIHIQPVFPREAGAAAWVVPFTARPTVMQGNADFIDQLELLTSPVFVEYCWGSSNAGCGMKAAGGDSNGTATSQDASVTVWEQGEVGSLDYVILTASEGGDIASWLSTEGYEVTAAAAALLGTLDADGVFFFAARLDAAADPTTPLSPIRFVLPDMAEPTYPLELTALGVPAGEALDLTVWIIVPDGDQVWAPSSHPFETLRSYLLDEDLPRTPAEYSTALDSFFSNHPAGTFLLLDERTSWEIDESINAGAFFTSDYFLMIPFADVGIEPPETWAGEFTILRTTTNYVYRYQARLEAEGMTDDLVLGERSFSSMPWASSAFEFSHGSCADDDPYGYGCAAAPSPAARAGRAGLAGLAGAVVLLVLAFVLSRSRRSR